MKLKLRTRNISSLPLKSIDTDIPTIYRMGSTTPSEKILNKNTLDSGKYIEINSPESCKISANKILTKEKLIEHGIPTAEYFIRNQYVTLDEFLDKVKSQLEDSPIIIKHKHSSGGTGLYYITSMEEYNDLPKIVHNNLEKYIFEKYYSYSKEYRLHCTAEGVFLANRKMLKTGAENRWRRHHDNSLWVLEENPLFDPPSNMEEIEDICVKALQAIGLDIGCFDIKVQTSKYKDPKYIILESNSAPALGEYSLPYYNHELKCIITKLQKLKKQ